MSPVQAATHFLKHLCEAWNHLIAKDVAAKRLENQEIILTVPASFDAAARELTVRQAQARFDAGLTSGVDVDLAQANQAQARVGLVNAQNGLEQARQFLKTAGVTGIVLTKLDGTAKGGIAVAISKELGLPIRYAGIGEKVDDLVVFDPEQYVNGLFQ